MEDQFQKASTDASQTTVPKAPRPDLADPGLQLALHHLCWQIKAGRVTGKLEANQDVLYWKLTPTGDGGLHQLQFLNPGEELPFATATVQLPLETATITLTVGPDTLDFIVEGGGDRTPSTQPFLDQLDTMRQYLSNTAQTQ